MSTKNVISESTFYRHVPSHPTYIRTSQRQKIRDSLLLASRSSLPPGQLPISTGSFCRCEHKAVQTGCLPHNCANTRAWKQFSRVMPWQPGCASGPCVLGQHTANLVDFGRLMLLSACISIRTCYRLFRIAVEVVDFRFLFLSEQLGFVSCYRTRTTDQ